MKGHHLFFFQDRIGHEGDMLLQLTPYMGMQVTGKVEHTFVRGQLVYSKGRFAHPVCGEPIVPLTKQMAFKGFMPT